MSSVRFTRRLMTHAASERYELAALAHTATQNPASCSTQPCTEAPPPHRSGAAQKKCTVVISFAGKQRWRRRGKHASGYNMDILPDLCGVGAEKCAALCISMETWRRAQRRRAHTHTHWLASFDGASVTGACPPSTQTPNQTQHIRLPCPPECLLWPGGAQRCSPAGCGAHPRAPAPPQPPPMRWRPRERHEYKIPPPPHAPPGSAANP